MLLLCLVWVASQAECFFSSGHHLLKTPDRLLSNFPDKILSVVNRSPIKASTFGGTAHLSSNFYVNRQSLFLVAQPSSTQPESRLHPQLAQTSASSLSNRLFAWRHPISSHAHTPTTPLPAVSQGDRKIETLLTVSSVPENPTSSGQPKGVFQFLQGVQNLFAWSSPTKQARAKTEPSPVTIVVADRVQRSQAQSTRQTRQRRFMLNALQSSKHEKRATKNALFQVWMKGYLIAELRDRVQAEVLAQRLEQLLQLPQLDASQLQPALINGLPAGKMGDRFLFVVDPSLATALGRNSELLAIDWINNLRVALSTPPLTLAEAQTKMYGLVETRKTVEGLASWYGPYFHGRITATGETFDQNALTAAHPSLPFDTYLKVTNLKSGNSVIVRINDRGPYFENRSLDLSREAARQLKSEEVGVVPFEAVIMEPPQGQRLASNPKLTGL